VIGKCRDQLGNVVVDGRIILKWIFDKSNIDMWIGFNSLRLL
jgi:hypothetical protein